MASRADVLAKALPILRAQLGVHEQPRGSNRTKYGAAYHWQGVAWCVIFAWWIAQQVGLASKYFPKTASVALLRDWARDHHRWSQHPRVLDIGLLPWGVSHAVIVEKLVSGDRVQCIAGNTNRAGSRDADTVCRKVYPVSCFAGFFRPQWAEATRVTASPTKTSGKLRRRYPGHMLKVGSPDHASIRAIQTELNRRAVTAPRLKADGIYGAHTASRVRGFQRQHHLEVDGIVGPKTWAVLWS